MMVLTIKIKINAKEVSNDLWNYFLRGGLEKYDFEEFPKPEFLTDHVWNQILGLAHLSEENKCIIESFTNDVAVW
jgi:hypothetical protein